MKDVVEAVDETMELVRNSEYLTDEVSKQQSITFLNYLAERCLTLAGEIAHEMLREARHNERAVQRRPE